MMYKVMAADDEPMMRKGLKALVDWKALDCELIDVLADGQALLDAVAAQPPDIIICDIKMPRKSGIDVAKEVYEQHLPIKVILLTAYADFSYAQQAINYGVSNYVTKTGAIDGIVDAVDKCKRQLQKELAPSSSSREKDVSACLKALFDGSLYEQSLVEKQTKELNLNLDSYTLLIAALENCGDADDSAAMRLTNHVRELLSEVGNKRAYYIVPMGRCQLCAVLPNAHFKSLFPLCQDLTSAFYSLTGEKLYIGVSGEGRTPFKLPVALKQAYDALEKRFFNHDDAVYLWDAHPQTAETADSTEYLDKISAAISSGIQKAAAQQLTALFEYQRKSGASPATVRSEGLVLLNLCKKHLVRMGASCDALDSGIETAVLECQYFEEYQALLNAFTAQSCHEIYNLQQYSSSLIAHAQNYIEANYLRPITLGEIAAAVGANPSYLSRAFKSKTGASIVSTINAKKMEKAKKLLTDGQLKVYEAASAVGITDTTYFSHLFRKYTGLSPKAWQEHN